MIGGFTLAYGHDSLAVFCDACPDGDTPIREFCTDVTPLAEVVKVAEEHAWTHAHPAPPVVRYGVMESREGGSWVVWDRRERRSVNKGRYREEEFAQWAADVLNAEERS
jgi:hypothetical protein